MNSAGHESTQSHRERSKRKRDPVRETAELYAASVPSVPLEVLEASLRLVAADTDALAAFNRCLAAHGFVKSSGRFVALRNLFFAGTKGLTTSELSRQINVTAPNVSYLVQALEEEGLVRRTSDGPDKRFTHLTLTDAGMTLCADLVPAAAYFSLDLFSDLSPADAVHLNDLLRRVQLQARDLFVD